MAEAETPSCLAVSARDKPNSIESTRSPPWFGNHFHENLSMMLFWTHGITIRREGQDGVFGIIGEGVPSDAPPGTALEALTGGKYDDERRV